MKSGVNNYRPIYRYVPCLGYFQAWTRRRLTAYMHIAGTCYCVRACVRASVRPCHIIETTFYPCVNLDHCECVYHWPPGGRSVVNTFACLLTGFLDSQWPGISPCLALWSWSTPSQFSSQFHVWGCQCKWVQVSLASVLHVYVSGVPTETQSHSLSAHCGRDLYIMACWSSTLLYSRSIFTTKDILFV